MVIVEQPLKQAIIGSNKLLTKYIITHNSFFETFFVTRPEHILNYQ